MTTTRPGKNTNGQAKKPSANPDGGPLPQLTPTAAHGVNPMTHPMHPDQQAMAQGGQPGGVKQSQSLAAAGGNPSGNPLGNITPTPTQDVRQVRENVNFHDLSPIEQSQAAEQQGLNPYLPLQMLQQQAQQAQVAGPSNGPVPNTLMGPFTPPGVESFPDDMAHLTQLMKQGYAPGAQPHELALAQNAHAIARARDAVQQGQADQTGPMPQHMQVPGAPPGAPMPPQAPPMVQGPQLPPGVPQPYPGASPMPGGIPLPSGAPQGPPAPPGAPQGGPPPELMQAIMAAAQRHKRPV